MFTNRKFKLFWNLIKILIAVFLVGYVFSRTNLNEFLSLHEKILPAYLIATLILYTCLTAFKAFMYQVMLEQDTQYLRVLNVIVLQNAVTNFFAVSAGLVSYLTMLKVEENVKMGRSGFVFLIVKVGDLLAVWFVMLVCGLLYWDQISGLQQMFVFVEGIIGSGLLLFFGILVFRAPFIYGISRLVNRFGLTRFSILRQGVQSFEAMAEMNLRNISRTVFNACWLTFIYYLITLIWMVASMYTFDLQVEAWVIVFVSGILQLFSMIPINIFGGLGVTEATALYLYPLFGVNMDELLPILLGWRILYYLTNLCVLIYLPVYAIFIDHKLQQKK
jgi:uncharacterized membrane protein YbhN (UPF0104 family)